MIKLLRKVRKKKFNMSEFQNVEYSEADDLIPRRFAIFPYEVELKDENYFSLLPDEIILKIFNFLPFWDKKQYSMVCKRWYSLSFDAELWKSVTISRQLKLSSLEMILNCPVQRLKLLGSRLIGQETSNRPFFKSIKFDNLQYLSIIGTKIKVNLLEELLELTPNLKVLKLNGVCEKISCKAFECINKMKLEELDLRQCNIEAAVFPNCQIFNRLRSLKLYDLEDSENLISLCPNLELLNLFCFNINDAVINEIVQIKNLKELNLDFSDVKVKDKILNILKSCNDMDKLRCLHVVQFGFGDHTVILKNILLHCSFLTVLDLQRYGNCVMFNLDIFEKILMMKHLQKLCLWRIGIIENIISVLNNLKKGKTLLCLEHLSICYDHFQNPCYEVEILLSLSPHIKYLHLEEICISSVIFECITTLKELEALFIYTREYRISSTRIAAILRGCPKLIEHNLPIRT